MNKFLSLTFVVYTLLVTSACSQQSSDKENPKRATKTQLIDPLKKLSFKISDKNPHEKYFQAFSKDIKDSLSRFTEQLDKLMKEKSLLTEEIIKIESLKKEKENLESDLDNLKKELVRLVPPTQIQSESCKSHPENSVSFYESYLNYIESKVLIQKILALQIYFKIYGEAKNYDLQKDTHIHKNLIELKIESRDKRQVLITLEEKYKQLNQSISMFNYVSMNSSAYKQLPDDLKNFSDYSKPKKLNAFKEKLNSLLASSKTVSASCEKEINENLKTQQQFNEKLSAQKLKIKELTDKTSEITLRLAKASVEEKNQKLQQIKIEITKINSQLSDLAETQKISQEYMKSLIKFVELKNALYTRFQNKKTIEITEIMEILTLEHLLLDQNTKVASFKIFNDSLDLVAKVSADKSMNHLGQFKVAYENYIEKTDLNGQAIIYNAAYDTLNSPIEYGRIQAYSGTLLFYRLLFAQSHKLNLKNKEMVVIIEEENILPGYVENDELFGIDTTAKGFAHVTYGPVSNVSGTINVYEAKQFLFTELFKWQILDLPKTHKQMEDFIKNHFGFNIQLLGKPNITNSSPDHTLPKVSHSPFFFSKIKLTDEDIERKEFEIRGSSIK